MFSNSKEGGMYGKSSASIQKEDSSNKNNWVCYVMSGLAGLALGAAIARHFCTNESEQILEKECQKSFEARRRQKRQEVRDLREDQICVVCRDNEREIILLPCGHFSLCVECSIKNPQSICPICREPIRAKTVVYS